MMCSKVTPGALFPALQRIEESGWATGEWGIRRAKYYAISRARRRQLGGRGGALETDYGGGCPCTGESGMNPPPPRIRSPAHGAHGLGATG